MKIELIESISLKVLHEQYFDELASESNRDCSRRDFLKLFTVTTAGLIVPSLYAQKTYGYSPQAIWTLIVAALSVLSDVITIGDSLGGKLQVDNKNPVRQNDNVDFKLVESIDMTEAWSDSKNYTVPPYHRNIYEYSTDSIGERGRFKLKAECGDSCKTVNNIIING